MTFIGKCRGEERSVSDNDLKIVIIVMGHGKGLKIVRNSHDFSGLRIASNVTFFGTGINSKCSGTCIDKKPYCCSSIFTETSQIVCRVFSFKWHYGADFG